MLRLHWGLPPTHRIKAVFRWWWCIYTENPLPADGDADRLFVVALGSNNRDDGVLEEYGAGIVWPRVSFICS